MKCEPQSSAAAYRGWMTRTGYVTGLRLSDLAVLANTFGFCDAFEFEEFAQVQQAKAWAREDEAAVT